MLSVWDQGYNHVELLFGSFANRSKPIIQELKQSNLLADWYGHEKVDAFTSAFMFKQDYKEHVQKTGTMSQFSGLCGIDFLYWDFDSDNLVRAWDDATVLTERLIDKGVHWGNILRFFSGAKGFHVLCYLSDLQKHAGSPSLPAMVKGVCEELGKGLHTMDKAIYNKDRLFRTCNSKHSKTGLYKVPLNDLPGYSDLLEFAKTQHKLDVSNFSDDGCDTVFDTSAYALQLNTSSTGMTVNARKESLAGLSGGVPKGSRNNTLARLAGLLHSKNLGTDLVRDLCHAVNAQGEEPLSEREVDTVVSSISRYPVDSKYVVSKNSDILTFEDCAKAYVDMRSRHDKMQYGFPHIDKLLPYFDEKDVLLVAARAGVAKTNFSMQFCNNLSKFCGQKGLFVSLEMASSFIFLRAASIEANRHSEVAKDVTAVSSMVMTDPQFIREVAGAWSNLLVVDKSSLDMAQIEQFYVMAEEQYGKMACLLIDYGGLISGADDYEGVTRIAKSFKQIAKRLSTRLVVIFQMSRQAGDGTIPVRMEFLRDSGAIEEGADYILGAWRDKEDDKRIHMRFLKNRHLEEHNATFDMINHGLCFTSVDTNFKEDRW